MAVITTVWRLFFEVVSKQNATMHGNTKDTHQAALFQKITQEIRLWFKCQDQLLHTDCSNILESKVGGTIKPADLKIFTGKPHFLLNCLKMYNPILGYFRKHHNQFDQHGLVQRKLHSN
jgi:hypothetical protein